MKNKKTESEILYEEALESADTIYNLAVITAKEGIMEELEPKIKRFVSRKLQTELESSDELEDEELENILDIEESEESEEDEVIIDEPEEITDEAPIDDEISAEIDIDDISDEIELDLSDILDDTPDEIETTDVEIEEPVEDDEIEEAQIAEEDEELDIEIEDGEDDDEELINLEALVKEISDGEAQSEDEELDIEIEDDEIEESYDKSEDEEDIKEQLEKALAENTKLKTGITVLKEKVDEYVLVNKKLKLISKVFGLNNFSKREKLKVIEAFDRATTVKDSIKVFNTITEAVKKRNKKKITEGTASKVIGTTKPPKEKIIIEQDDQTFKKWSRLSTTNGKTFLDD